MWAKMKRWLEVNSLTGLEVILGQEGVVMVHACTLNISGDQLSVRDQQPGLKNTAHFGKHYQPSPVALCLTGRGILVKSIPDVVRIDQQVIQNLLPNAKVEDFYFQLDHGDDRIAGNGQATLFMIRRSVADAVISQLSRLGFQVVSLSLNPPPSGTIPEGSKPELSRAYAAAFQVLLGQNYSEVESDALSENKAQLFARTKVMGIAAVSGCILMLMLLINFFLFSHYRTQSADLADRNNQSGQEVRKFREMETGIAQKTTLINEAGWTGGYPMAWLTDQLMATRPASVRISLLSINPMKTQSLPGAREELYESGRIKVTGTCDKAATLNNWLFEIRGKDWVKECSISAYEMNRETEKGQFTIDIYIEDYEG